LPLHELDFLLTGTGDSGTGMRGGWHQIPVMGDVMMHDSSWHCGGRSLGGVDDVISIGMVVWEVAAHPAGPVT